MEDRTEIATGVKPGWLVTAIAAHVGRCKSVISREVRRNCTTTGYRVVAANTQAAAARTRRQARAIDADPVLAARVRADLKASRTPRQIAGRLRLEAGSGRTCRNWPELALGWFHPAVCATSVARQCDWTFPPLLCGSLAGVGIHRLTPRSTWPHRRTRQSTPQSRGDTLWPFGRTAISW